MSKEITLVLTCLEAAALSQAANDQARRLEHLAQKAIRAGMPKLAEAITERAAALDVLAQKLINDAKAAAGYPGGEL